MISNVFPIESVLARSWMDMHMNFHAVERSSRTEPVHAQGNLDDKCKGSALHTSEPYLLYTYIYMYI